MFISFDDMKHSLLSTTYMLPCKNDSAFVIPDCSEWSDFTGKTTTHDGWRQLYIDCLNMVDDTAVLLHQRLGLLIHRNECSLYTYSDSIYLVGSTLYICLKAHYKDFHNDFSKKTVVKIFVHILDCWKNLCSCEKKL
mgnify:CR=1 FL=1